MFLVLLFLVLLLISAAVDGVVVVVVDADDDDGDASQQISSLFYIKTPHFTIMYSFFVVVFMPPKELWEAYSNRTVRLSVCQSVRPSFPLCVLCISPIFLEVGIPNLVCGCVLG